MELIIALVLFIGLIGFWTMLPGSTSTNTALTETKGWEATGEPAAAQPLA